MGGRGGYKESSVNNEKTRKSKYKKGQSNKGAGQTQFISIFINILHKTA
jgi:hypothetical protein